jgi:hypothetical protein
MHKRSADTLTPVRSSDDQRVNFPDTAAIRGYAPNPTDNVVVGVESDTTDSFRSDRLDDLLARRVDVLPDLRPLIERLMKQDCCLLDEMRRVRGQIDDSNLHATRLRAQLACQVVEVLRRDVDR